MEDLGGLYRTGLPTVPPALDRAILQDARAGFARRRRFWLLARAAGATAAAAAAAVVVIVLYLNRKDAVVRPVAGTQQVAPRGDLDGNGRVDVLDAYLLAKKVEQRAAVGTGEDVNGDGVLDQRDVDRVAEIAVRL
jgi:negative regulator of sigma E activity